MPLDKAACTTISWSHWKYALALGTSFLRQHPESGFHILVVDGPVEGVEVPAGMEVHWGEDVAGPGFASWCMRYDAMELITSLKAPFLRRLLERYPKVIHLDSDVRVYHRLDTVWDRLETASVVVTPHLVSPLPDHEEPGEGTFLLAADHNSGFIGFRRSEAGIAALEWLAVRCRENCYEEPSAGLCTDQKWYNLLPALFPEVHVERSVGLNVAYWNLHERVLSFSGGRWWVNGKEPLVFFHFSGCQNRDRFTKHPSRFDFGNRPEMRALVAGYFEAIEAQAGAGKGRGPKGYRFGFFSNGEPISGLIRRLYSVSPEGLAGGDPFDARGPFYRFCEERGLLGPEPAALGLNRWNTRHEDWRLRLIRVVFRGVLRMVGAARYGQWLGHLQWITSVRNQAGLFFGDSGGLPERSGEGKLTQSPGSGRVESRAGV
jgi:hypothetical protein